ncbi:hypothetical protein [Nocardia cyriacigeorgica]
MNLSTLPDRRAAQHPTAPALADDHTALDNAGFLDAAHLRAPDRDRHPRDVHLLGRDRPRPGRTRNVRVPRGSGCAGPAPPLNVVRPTRPDLDADPVIVDCVAGAPVTMAEAVIGVEAQGLGGPWPGRGVRGRCRPSQERRESGAETVPRAVPMPSNE